MATTSKSPAKTAAKKTATPRAKQAVKTTSVPAAESTKIVKRKELVERIVASSGLKPNVIKSVLDATLKEIGDTLSAGETLQLPSLGKVSVNRRKDIANGEVMICKIRRRTAAPAAATPAE